MIRQTMLAASVLLFAPLPAAAQSMAQDELQSRYDRALAAGYSALFLCGAIANAEANGVTRTPASVMAMELTGIYPALEPLVRDLPYRIMRAEGGSGVLSWVETDWAADAPPRIAWHEEAGGCSLGPIGMVAPPARERLPRSFPLAIVSHHDRILPGGLAEVFAQGMTSHYGADARTTALIVSGRQGDGYQRYAADFGPATPQRTWSVAKSIAATLVGAAVQRGDVDVQDSAGLGESDADPRRAISIDNALRMASGRYTDTPGNRTDALYAGGATVDEVAVDWPMVSAPGATFRYANNDTLAAVQAIEPSFDAHPPAELFHQLGMDNTVAETDWQGNYILSSQVWTTAPDLMRLGQLYLNDGVLPDGTRVLPEGWVDYVSSPSGPQPNDGFGYGAGWWLMNDIQGVPSDTFAAFGNRGQYVVVVPSLDVVIVRRGEDPAGGQGFDIAAFTRDVLAALESTDIH